MQRHLSIALTLLGVIIAVGTEVLHAGQTALFPFRAPDRTSGYIDACSFVDNRAWIVFAKLVGYIDRTGRSIVTPRFVASSDVLNGGKYSREYGGEYFGEDYSDGLASVLTGRGCWSYIDTGGRFVWQFAGRAGEVPRVEPASTPPPPPPTTTSGSPVEQARALAAKGEAAEMAGTRRLSMEGNAFDATASALESYGKSHPDDVEVILLSARLGRLQEVLAPVTAGAPHVEEDLKAAATRIHAHIDALESLLDHAIVITPRNAEAYYWKARLYGIRTPPLLATLVKNDVRDMDRATDAMKKAVELAPGVVLYNETLASYLVESQRFSEAATSLSGVAGGRHPMYLLLKDLEQVHVPPGAVPDFAGTERLVEMKRESGEMPDYANLRIRSWAIPGSAAGVEAFYRAKWPGFVFLKKPFPIEPPNGVALTMYFELLRWEAGGLVPLGKPKSFTEKDAQNKIMITLMEVRADSGNAREVIPSAELLPEGSQKLFCVVAVFNRHVVNR